MKGERSGHTLQPTALVHEAYLNLIDTREIDWQNRSHFLALAANIMKRILSRHARARRAKKRPPSDRRVPLIEERLPGTQLEVGFSDLDEAMERLKATSDRMSRIVEMRYFGGMTVDEVAFVLKVTPRTVQREWKAAKLFLLDAMSGQSP